MADYDHAFRIGLNIAEQTAMMKRIEETIISATQPESRATVQTMLETYRLMIESRCRNEFMSILLDAREKKQSKEEEVE